MWDDTPSSLVIEPMTVSDLAEVTAIEQLSQGSPWPEQLFRDELSRDFAYMEVARVRRTPDTSEVTAFCNYWLVHDEVHLLNLATHPSWRRRGIATRLIEHLIDFARAHQCRYITLEVRASNHGARALYAAHGFVAQGVRPKYYSNNGEDAVVMTLELSGVSVCSE